MGRHDWTPKPFSAKFSDVHRPLETTLWMRLTQFLKGVFLYNTIYWRRASDDLDIQRMSREERANLRPKRDLEIIRPRENPRPTNASVLSLPPEVSEPVRSVPSAVGPVEPSSRPVVAGEEEGVEMHRRKKRRRSRHSKVMPKQYYDSTYEGGGGGFFGRWFKK